MREYLRGVMAGMVIYMIGFTAVCVAYYLWGD